MSDEEDYDSDRYDSDVDDDDKASENDAGKRAYHNLLERKRRDNIKDSFCQLRDVVPYFRNKKKTRASRVQILKKTVEYIKKHPNLDTLEDESESIAAENILLEKLIKEMNDAMENNDQEAIERLAAMETPFKRRIDLLAGVDSSSEDGESSDEDGGSSPSIASVSSSPRKAKKLCIKKKF